MYSSTLLSSHTVFVAFFLDSFGFPQYTIISLANKISFNIFFLNLRHIIFYPAFALTRSSNTMLKKGDESGHHCLVTNFSGKISNIPQLRMMLFVGFSLMGFIHLRKYSIPCLMVIILKCQFTRSFFACIEAII